MGEFDLIERVRRRISELGVQGSSESVPLGAGDDAAVTVRAGATVTSVDAFVEGVHFRRADSTLAAIGRKALAAALSDLAAMGAEPGEAYVAIGVPPDLGEDESLEVLDGLAAGARRWRTALAGGDVTRAPTLLLCLTVVGCLESAEQAVSRGGASADDLLVVTGTLGGAAAGLLLLELPELADSVDPDLAERLRRRQLAPEPRLAAGRALALAGATAMIDLSDGLAGDAAHIASAGDVRVEVDLTRLPLEPGLAELARAAGRDPLELAVSGGEDYELLAAIPADRLDVAARAVAETGTTLSAVGGVRPGAGVALRDSSGKLRTAAGFDQLR